MRETLSGHKDEATAPLCYYSTPNIMSSSEATDVPEFGAGDETNDALAESYFNRHAGSSRFSKHKNMASKSLRLRPNKAHGILALMNDHKALAGNDDALVDSRKIAPSDEQYILTGSLIMRPEAYLRNIKWKEEVKHIKQQQRLLRNRSLREVALLRRTLVSLKTTDSKDRVMVDGGMYAVCEQGYRLQLLKGNTRLPTHLQWNNAGYYKKANGDLLKMGAKSPGPDLCRFFTRLGMCSRGARCRFRHDLSKIALCREDISGGCRKNECTMSHEWNQFNAPLCRFFLEDRCNNLGCLFMHLIPLHATDPGTEVAICRPFALDGYCLRGANCPFLHLFNCPDYEETASCPRKEKCKLSHKLTRWMEQGVHTVITSNTVSPSELFVRGKPQGLANVHHGSVQVKSEHGVREETGSNMEHDIGFQNGYGFTAQKVRIRVDDSDEGIFVKQEESY